MDSPSHAAERRLRRHDLVFLSGSAWRTLMQTRADLAGEPLVAGWNGRGWPLVARRPLPGEACGVALGLPLPPSAGKRRIDMLVQPDDIVGTAAPLALDGTYGAAPAAWRPTLARLEQLARRDAVEVRVFGSLAWRALTGLDYLRAGSDLDFLMPLRRGSDPAALAEEIAAIEAAAPMRLDGEFVRDDGAAVNWREWLAGEPEVLAKTLHEVRLLPADRFNS